jgi:DNA modification methylase
MLDQEFLNQIYQGDCIEILKLLPDECIDCCVTSPPYYALRDYGYKDQIGLEETPRVYVDKITEVFIEVRRVLKKEGTLWLNIGDSYAGSGKSGNNETYKKSTHNLAKQFMFLLAGNLHPQKQ